MQADAFVNRRRANRVRLGAGLLPLMLSACAGGPPSAPHGIQATAAGMGLTGPPATIAPDWWRGLGDPQLDRIENDALATNPTLDQAMARVDTARAGLATSQSAGQPQIEFSGAFSEQRISGAYFIPPPYGGTWHGITTAQASLAYSLDLAGRQRALIRAARGQAVAAALDAAAARLALAGSVAQTYVALSRAQADHASANAVLALRQRAVRLNQARQTSGLGSAIDVQTATARLDDAQAALLRAQQDEALAQHALAELAGHGADYYATIGQARLRLMAVRPVDPGSVLPLDLLSRRADIQAAQMRITASEAGQQAARAAYYPDVDLSAFVGAQSLTPGGLLTGGALVAGIGPALHLPIFTGGRLKAGVASANAAYDGAIADYNTAVVRAVREAADALAGLGIAQAQAANDRREVDAVTQGGRLMALRVTSGLASPLDQLPAQERLAIAQQALSNAGADVILRQIQLYVALGGGLASPVVAPERTTR